MKQDIINILYKKTAINKNQLANLIEIPPNPEMGDFAFPTFILTKKQKKSPQEIAKKITEELNKKLPKQLEKVEDKGPYVNFFLDKSELAKQITNKSNFENFGKQNQKQKILLEHTSVNPNASPHVGRARNSIIGDSIYRILTFLGNKVERHYYVNDVSKQIAMLTLNFKEKDNFNSLLKKYIEISNKLKDNPELEKQIFDILKKFEEGDKQTTKQFKKIVETAVDGQKKIFNKFGIEFDYFDYESKYLKSSQLILEKFEKTGKLFEDKEGRLVLNQSNTPVVKKMKAPYFVLARSNKTGLYQLRDVAYTLEKIKTKARNIIVLGEDQKLYFEQLSEALKLLNYPAPEVVHYSFVLIQTDKGTSKMSTRKGELVLLEEFFDEAVTKAKNEIKKRKTKGNPEQIAIAAIKYAMLRNDNDKNIIFSWDTSLNFEGESGPYLQYTYARASSILKKATTPKAKAKKTATTKHQIPEKLTPNEIALIKKILDFPNIVEQAGQKLNPSMIANYSFQLAQTFNEFYHNCKVVGDQCQGFRLKLVDSFRTTIKNSLYLLGIEVMEEM